jgi:Fe-S cluster biogenesis protein NfuA
MDMFQAPRLSIAKASNFEPRTPSFKLGIICFPALLMLIKQMGMPLSISRIRRKTMKEKVIEALNAIRPYLQMDGGDVELVDIVDGVVKVRLRGACAGCPGATMTLKLNVERVLREKVPELKGLVAV